MSDSPDSHELDALESLEISEGHALVRARVCSVIDAKHHELERERDPLTAAEARGFIAACRTFLNLPAILREEIKSQMKEKR